MNLAELPKDRRGLPIPYVAAWSSEHWSVARADPYVGWRMSLFTAGRYGRGQPCFDVMNEPRQREVVMRGLCQVCTTRLDVERHTGKPIGFLPTSAIEVETIGRLDDGTPVTAEPLCCEACTVYVVEHCCVLAKRPERGIVRVVDWSPLAQFVDPSAAPPTHERRFDHEGDLERLGRIARRHGGLIGLVKVVLHEVEPV